jgi:hypothetical protein
VNARPWRGEWRRLNSSTPRCDRPRKQKQQGPASNQPEF